jgi:DNA helicase-2/ATP-dependent DNA helicase PcrA
MEKNYRSTQQIVRQADRFIRQNTDRHSKNIVTDNEEGSPIQQIRVKDRLEQYERIVMLAKQSSEETAVLYRDNDSAIPLIDLLQRQRLSYCAKNMDSTFFSHWITQDIIDILLFAENPKDGNRFLRIYYKLGMGISKEQAAEAANRAHADRLPIWDELMKGHFSERVLSRIRSVKNHLLLLPGETAARALWRIENALGYGTYLKKRKADPGKLTILKILAESEQTPKEFLTRLKGLEQMVKAGSADPNAHMILSTIHSSKGLEYEQVILADIADGILPQSAPAELTRKEKQDLLEEERRLFYVAMTRAKRKLLVFRFQEQGLSSSFLSVLFPESPHPAATSGKAAPRAVLSGTVYSAAKPRSSVLSEQTIAELHRQYAPKARIFHKAFGPGTVQSHTDSILTIQFDKGSVKRFRIPDVLEINVLSLL